MRNGRLKVGLAVVAAFGAALTLVAQPAFADLAPTSADAVGVGSDTLQYMIDFGADGSNAANVGYNKGKLDVLINIDATADANARLAYGPGGEGSVGGTCAPGTGPSAGTGNQTAPHSDQPCTLNPTVVLRAGTSPVQRPNGSGAGAKAIAADTAHYITFSRASACQGPTTGCGGALSSAFDSVELGTDPLAMLQSTTPASNAMPLSAQQLKLIYSCAGPGTNGAETWASLGGTSPDNVIAFIPQVGSGTRSTFLTDIGLASTFVPPSCVQVSEENDPTAIGTALSQGGSVAAGTSDAEDAIEPMSGGRLNLFLGDLSTGAANGVGGYFKDPSCPLQDINNATPTQCGGSVQGGPAGANTISPAVKLVTTGTPLDGNALFDVQRPLYVYFRDSDINSNTQAQPTSTPGLNWIRTLFYNPCPNPNDTTGTCVAGPNGPNQFGPGGEPWFEAAQGQADISAAGVSPTWAFQAGGP